MWLPTLPWLLADCSPAFFAHRRLRIYYFFTTTTTFLLTWQQRILGHAYCVSCCLRSVNALFLLLEYMWSLCFFSYFWSLIVTARMSTLQQNIIIHVDYSLQSENVVKCKQIKFLITGDILFSWNARTLCPQSPWWFIFATKMRWKMACEIKNYYTVIYNVVSHSVWLISRTYHRMRTRE